jgi:hypothetical protein
MLKFSCFKTIIEVAVYQFCAVFTEDFRQDSCKMGEKKFKRGKNFNVS